MNTQQKGIITLIKSALEGKAYPLPEDFDMDQAVSEAFRHKILALTYYGALNCGVDKKAQPMKQLFSGLILTMNITEKQRFEISKLFAAFEEQKVEYLPMKGTILQDIYPKCEMRTMGDADILIRMEQNETISGIMAALGYEFLYESDHELVWKKGKVVVELHKCVIPTYETDYYAYFGDGWKRAKRISPENGIHELTPEDFYIYLFVHFAKHYRMSGVGIKHVVDLQVYQQAHPELDGEYIRSQLEEMDLLRFYDYVTQMMGAWFEDKELTDRADYITQVIFESGEYGLSENYEATRILRAAKESGSVEKTRSRDQRSTLFLNLKTMQGKYPVLCKAPFLLPVFWVVRWVDILLFKRNKLKKYVKIRKATNAEGVEKYKQALDFVGLNYLDKESAE